VAPAPRKRRDVERAGEAGAEEDEDVAADKGCAHAPVCSAPRVKRPRVSLRSGALVAGSTTTATAASLAAAPRCWLW
jgi:hypothetical protein